MFLKSTHRNKYTKNYVWYSLLYVITFYEQSFVITQKESLITQNKSKKSEGNNFASQKYLIKIIHSIIALYF